jgi:glutamine cyclotransferase
VALLAVATVGVAAAPQCTYRVINTYPHDPNAFTQGLVYADGRLYESTGLYGSSSLREVVLETGSVIRLLELSGEHFGEGLTLWQDRLIQLTWQNQVAWAYSEATFEVVDTYSYTTEGWGLTHDGERLIMSDGSSVLSFRDPLTFELLGRLRVYGDDGPVIRLNELEYIDGQLYANIWLTDLVARIDPATGEVTAWIDLTGLLPPGTPANVLNGIAYDADSDRIFVTGKLWPSLFEIEILDCADSFVLADGLEPQ